VKTILSTLPTCSLKVFPFLDLDGQVREVHVCCGAAFDGDIEVELHVGASGERRTSPSRAGGRFNSADIGGYDDGCWSTLHVNRPLLQTLGDIPGI
jgi:hypothetical protein